MSENLDKINQQPDLLFGALGFGVLGEERRVQGLQGFAFGAEESLSSFLQGPAQRGQEHSQSAVSSPVMSRSQLRGKVSRDLLDIFMRLKKRIISCPREHFSPQFWKRELRTAVHYAMMDGSPSPPPFLLPSFCFTHNSGLDIKTQETLRHRQHSQALNPFRK